MMDSKKKGATDTGRNRVPSQQIAMSEPSVTSSKASEKNRMVLLSINKRLLFRHKDIRRRFIQIYS